MHFLRRRGIRTAVFTAAVVLLGSPPAFAGAPTERLREFFGKVNAVLTDPATEERPLERVARVRRLVNDVADMRAAAASALGPFWETRTSAERDEFTTVFSEMIERAYVGRLAGVARGGRGVAPIYLDESVSGDDALVVTQLRGGGHELRVDYRMTQQGTRWRVRDIVLDGVSTVDNYRAQFRRLSQSGAHATLVKQMRAKLAEESFFFARAVSPTPVTPVIAAAASEPRDATPAPLASTIEPAPAPALVATPLPAPLVRETPRVAGRVVAPPSRIVARPAMVAALAPPAAAPVVVSPPPTPPAAGGASMAFWIAIVSVIAGGGIVILGWRAPSR